MAGQGYLTLYSSAKFDDWRKLLDDVFGLINADKIDSGSKTDVESMDWLVFIEEAEFDDDDDDEFLGANLPLKAIEEIELEEKGNICLNLSASVFSKHIYDELRRAIPEELSLDFVPSRLSLRVGPHDIFECVENQDGHYFGRATFSFTLWGDGFPEDVTKYREHIFSNAELIRFKEKLEQLIGPLEQCIYWDV